jgi:hypothetical protein
VNQQQTQQEQPNDRSFKNRRDFAMKKRIILVLLLALALILFISCTNTNDNGAAPDAPANANNPVPGEVIIESFYFFRSHDGQITSLGRSPVKINPVTQNVLFVCPDPLCDHDSNDCPLFNCMRFYAAGNYLFYVKHIPPEDILSPGGFASRAIFIYDMENGGVRQLGEYEAMLTVIGTAGSYLYYYEARRFGGDEENLIASALDLYYVLLRADAETGNIIEIEEYFERGPWGRSLYDIFNGNLHWHAYDADGNAIYYTTDLDGKNKQTVDFNGNNFLIMGKCRGGYAYYTEWNDLNDFRLYRISFGGGDAELLNDSVMDFIVLGDKIYYTVLQDDPELIEQHGGQTWNRSGGKIYVMNTDGTNQRVLAETGYNLSNRISMEADGFIEAKTIDGIDYLAWSYTVIEQASHHMRQEGYRFALSPDTIIINGSTGEWVVLSAPE